MSNSTWMDNQDMMYESNEKPLTQQWKEQTIDKCSKMNESQIIMFSEKNKYYKVCNSIYL